MKNWNVWRDPEILSQCDTAIPDNNTSPNKSPPCNRTPLSMSLNQSLAVIASLSSFAQPSDRQKMATVGLRLFRIPTSLLCAAKAVTIFRLAIANQIIAHQMEAGLC